MPVAGYLTAVPGGESCSVVSDSFQDFSLSVEFSRQEY